MKATDQDTAPADGAANPAEATGPKRRRRAAAQPPKQPAPAVLPPHLPPTEEERRQEKKLLGMMKALHVQLQRNNLDRALALASRAAAGRLPPEAADLVEHFGELGRRFGHLLDQAQKPPSLRVLDGGKA